MIDKQKIKEAIDGLRQQRAALTVQINMVDGALQLCEQLIADDEKEEGELLSSLSPVAVGDHA